MYKQVYNNENEHSLDHGRDLPMYLELLTGSIVMPNEFTIKMATHVTRPIYIISGMRDVFHLKEDTEEMSYEHDETVWTLQTTPKQKCIHKLYKFFTINIT